MTNGRDPAEITRLAIQRRMSRRTFLAGTGAGLGAMALAACAPPSSGRLRHRAEAVRRRPPRAPVPARRPAPPSATR